MGGGGGGLGEVTDKNTVEVGAGGLKTQALEERVVQVAHLKP